MSSAISDHPAEIVARAPGKAVLLGEYAVLDGAPALSMAVNRYARVKLRSCMSDACQVDAPQLGIDPVPFSLTSQGEIRWPTDAPGWSALQRTAELLGYLHARASRRFGPAGPFQLQIDTSELFLPADQAGQAQAVKLGLGSSSAVAVALDAVLRRFFGGQTESGLTTRALNRLLEPYRRGQDGRGSGIDLATSLCGGVIGFRLPVGSGDESPLIERLTLPPGLMMLFAWTGEPASTSELLELYRRWQAGQPENAQVVFQRMNKIAAQARQSIDRGDAEALMASLRAYGHGMGTMGDQMGVNLVSERHEAIMRRAEELGLVAKPSGAGVGDLALIAGTDPNRIESMRRWLDQQAIPEVALALDDNGVQVD